VLVESAERGRQYAAAREVNMYADREVESYWTTSSRDVLWLLSFMALM
jgi:hypothetical protein